MRFFTRKTSIISALFVGSLALSGCSAAALDTQFYWGDDNDLHYDMSQQILMDRDSADSVADEDNASADSVCSALSGSNSLVGFSNDGVAVSEDHEMNNNTIRCVFTAEGVSVASDSSVAGLDISRDADDKTIHVSLDTDSDDAEYLNTLQNQDTIPETIWKDFGYVFEFPGEVSDRDAGVLIAQRNYDGTVERDRIVNDSVSESDILHITFEEAIENGGFQVSAEDGTRITWGEYAAIGMSAVAVVLVLSGVVVAVRRRRSEKKRNAPARLSLADPHDITLDNPNPYRSTTLPVDDEEKIDAVSVVDDDDGDTTADMDATEDSGDAGDGREETSGEHVSSPVKRKRLGDGVPAAIPTAGLQEAFEENDGYGVRDVDSGYSEDSVAEDDDFGEDGESSRSDVSGGESRGSLEDSTDDGLRSEDLLDAGDSSVVGDSEGGEPVEDEGVGTDELSDFSADHGESGGEVQTDPAFESEEESLSVADLLGELSDTGDAESADNVDDEDSGSDVGEENDGGGGDPRVPGRVEFPDGQFF